LDGAGARFLALFRKKTEKSAESQFHAVGAETARHGQSAVGNAALAVSTAALSFTNMERMAQSMVAVKTAAKSDVRFIAVSFRMGCNAGSANCFRELDGVRRDILADFARLRRIWRNFAETRLHFNPYVI
jgi:hypothetical protein